MPQPLFCRGTLLSVKVAVVQLSLDLRILNVDNDDYKIVGKNSS
jgi:hypothetical protein